MAIKKPVKKVVKKVPVKKKTVSDVKRKITIVVKYDCGYDNHLTLRGVGGGLSWYRGVPLINKGSDEWVIEFDARTKSLEFKVLINDQVFEMGDNHTVKQGETFYCSPQFH
jgi:hypothetical protein